ncbi:MAG: APC family permease [Vibrio sp.]
MNTRVHSQKMSILTSTSPTVSKTKMGFLSMMAICIGLVIVQGAMIAATQGIGIGGSAFIAALICAYLLAQFNAMSFAELSLMFPKEGTLATYTKKAIGHFPAIVAVFSGYVFVSILAMPVEMFLVDAMLNQLFPGVFPEKLVPIALLATLTITNLIGTDVFSKIQNLLAFVLVVALIMIGFVAITGIDSPHPVITQNAVDWSLNGVLDGSFIGLIALAMWLMVGVEFICPMIQQVDNPNKTIPRAMSWSLTAILLIFLAFAYGASLYLDTQTLLESPIPYLNYANAVFGPVGLFIATLMAIAATCSSMNTLLASIPLMMSGMAEEGQAFPQLKVKNKHGVPWVGVLFISISTSISFLISDADSILILVIAATTSWLFAYMITHVDVIVLRRRLPNISRPYKTPFYPIPQILGIVGMGYVALHNSPSPEMTQLVFTIAGGILLSLSIISAIWVKFFMKKGLFTPDMSD